MSSPNFEHAKRQHPELSALIDRLGEYIQQQIASGQAYIIPKLAAAAIHITDGEAFVLLEILAADQLVRRVYNVYCRDKNALLATVESLEDLDSVFRCDFCNADHDPSNLKVEVAFKPASSDSTTTHIAA